MFLRFCTISSSNFSWNSIRFLPDVFSVDYLDQRLASKITSLALSLSVLIMTPSLWAETGTRRRVTLGFTTLRHPAISAFLLHGSRAAPHRRRLLTAEFRRPHQSTCCQGSSRRQPPAWIFPLPAFALWIAPCRSVLTAPSRPARTTTTIGRTHGRRDRLVRRTDGKRCFYSVREPGPLRPQPPTHRSVRLSGPTARPKEQEALRLIAASFLESWTLARFRPESAGQSSQWPLTCGLCAGRLGLLRPPGGELPRGYPTRLRSAPQTRTPSSPTTRVCRSSSLACSGTPHGPSRARLLLATSARLPTSCAPTSRSPTSTSTASAKGGDPSTVVTGNFRKAPDKLCSNFTVANVHINNECASHLIALIRDLCLKLGTVVLTCDFNKGAERELPTWCLREPAPHFPARASLQFGTCCLAHLGVYAPVGTQR